MTETGVTIPTDVSAFHDDIYKDVAEWMVEQGLADQYEDIVSVSLTVSAEEMSVVLTDYQLRDTVDAEVDTL
jgi:hypothetical protein